MRPVGIVLPDNLFAVSKVTFASTVNKLLAARSLTHVRSQDLPRRPHCCRTDNRCNPSPRRYKTSRGRRPLTEVLLVSFPEDQDLKQSNDRTIFRRHRPVR